ncbi:MAG TPA: phosphate acetyltransferase [Bacillota bacterium]|nr:phosphate acetyltransferase [Bacillota bacterium]
MSNLFAKLAADIKGNGKSIVFPEAHDERILTAAERLAAENILTPILIGAEEKINNQAEQYGVDVSSCTIIDPQQWTEFEEMVDALVTRRKGKTTEAEARELLQQGNYFGTMLVYMDHADGLVSGAVHSTADTVRPALQIIKTKEGIAKTSGSFLMVRDDERYVFADCAINIAPDSQDLAEIALTSAHTAQLFGIDPRIAMLSFSTKGSAKSDETEKVVNALHKAKEMDSSLVIDGELQFDAAFVPDVAQTKAPGSVIAGDANVFVFPSLEAGNIAYKMAQRLGGFTAVGPILQGLNKPVNDLSRGCTAEDVYNLALITAAQAD